MAQDTSSSTRAKEYCNRLDKLPSARASFTAWPSISLGMFCNRNVKLLPDSLEAAGSSDIASRRSSCDNPVRSHWSQKDSGLRCNGGPQLDTDYGHYRGAFVPHRPPHAEIGINCFMTRRSVGHKTDRGADVGLQFSHVRTALAQSTQVRAKKCPNTASGLADP